MEKERIIPPVGMCGEIPKNIPNHIQLLAATPYDAGQRVCGKLSIHNNPVIPIRFMRGSMKTEWIDAMIDTGSFYSLAKRKIFESIGITPIGYSEADSIESGNVLYETYASSFQIANLAIGFSTLFPILNDSFQYDAIIGSHFFEISNLNINGNEKTFEMIFF